MADVNSDADESSARTQQDWEVVSLSASGMSAASAPASADDSPSLTASGMSETSELPGVTASLLHSQHFLAPYPSQPDDKVIYSLNVGEVAASGPEEASSEESKELGLELDLGRGVESQHVQLFGPGWIHAISNRAISPGDSSITTESLNISEFELKPPGVEAERVEENVDVKFSNLPSSVMTSAASVASHLAMDKGGPAYQEEHTCAVEEAGDTWARDFIASNQEGLNSTGGEEDSGDGEEQEKVHEEPEELPNISSTAPVLTVTKEHLYEGWWKRKATIWLLPARHANSFWSLALAAAVMGLVLLGHRWHRERCQNQQLRLQLYSREDVRASLAARLHACSDYYVYSEIVWSARFSVGSSPRLLIQRACKRTKCFIGMKGRGCCLSHFTCTIWLHKLLKAGSGRLNAQVHMSVCSLTCGKHAPL